MLDRLELASVSPYPHTRRIAQPRRPQTRRIAHATLATGEVVAAALPITPPLAGAARLCEEPIKPIPIAMKAARTIILMLVSSNLNHCNFDPDSRIARAILSLGAGCRRLTISLQTDRALHIGKGPLASDIVAGAVRFARTRHGSHGLADPCAVTVCTFSGRERARRRRQAESLARLAREPRSIDDRLDLGVDPGLHPLDLLGARAGAAGLRREA